MKAFNDYDEAKKEANRVATAKLPVGAYVCKVKEVRYEESEWGDKIILAFDITEGEYKGFFAKQFEENTNEDKKWKGTVRIYCPKDDGSDKDKITKRTFASWISAFEASNKGYSWDWNEKNLKNKTVGIVFGETGTVIEGREVTYTEARFGVDAQVVRDGKAPEAKFKAKNGYVGTGTSGSSSSSDDGEFMKIPSDSKTDLPF